MSRRGAWPIRQAPTSALDQPVKNIREFRNPVKPRPARRTRQARATASRLMSRRATVHSSLNSSISRTRRCHRHRHGSLRRHDASLSGGFGRTLRAFVRLVDRRRQITAIHVSQRVPAAAEDPDPRTGRNPGELRLASRKGPDARQDLHRCPRERCRQLLIRQQNAFQQAP